MYKSLPIGDDVTWFGSLHMIRFQQVHFHVFVTAFTLTQSIAFSTSEHSPPGASVIGQSRQDVDNFHGTCVMFCCASQHICMNVVRNLHMVPALHTVCILTPMWHMQLVGATLCVFLCIKYKNMQDAHDVEVEIFPQIFHSWLFIWVHMFWVSHMSGVLSVAHPEFIHGLSSALRETQKELGVSLFLMALPHVAWLRSVFWSTSYPDSLVYWCDRSLIPLATRSPASPLMNHRARQSYACRSLNPCKSNALTTRPPRMVE